MECIENPLLLLDQIRTDTLRYAGGTVGLADQWLRPVKYYQVKYNGDWSQLRYLIHLRQTLGNLV